MSKQENIFQYAKTADKIRRLCNQLSGSNIKNYQPFGILHKMLDYPVKATNWALRYTDL